MQIIPNALPARPLIVRPVSTQNPRLLLGSGVFCLLLGCAFIWADKGRLMQDVTIPNDLETAEMVTLTEATCKTRAVILSYCQIKLVDRHPQGHGAQDLPAFMITKGSPKDVTILRSKSKPDMITTSLGQDHILSRIGLFAFLMAISFVGGCFWLMEGLRLRQTLASHRALSGQTLIAGLVEVSLGGSNPKIKTWRWNYRWDGVMGAGTAHTEWDMGMAPLVVEAAKTYAVAVMSSTSKLPMLVDSELRSLDLTAGERDHFRSAVAAVMA
jgi:hypothetical protein